jgi:CHAT domain-containing protein
LILPEIDMNEGRLSPYNGFAVKTCSPSRGRRLRTQVMRRIGWLLALLLCAGIGASAAGAADDVTPRGRRELERKAAALTAEGQRAYQAANYARAIAALDEALGIYRTLYPKTRFPEGHTNLANSLNSLGAMYYSAGEYQKAEPLVREALAMTRALFPRRKYPDGHLELALSLNNLASLHQAAGEYGKAEPLAREALEMHRALYPRAKFPDGHAELATSLNNLGVLYKSAGEYDKAEPLVREALEMNRALYPRAKYSRGHADLANSIYLLGWLYWSAEKYDEAEPLLREALDMQRVLYPPAKFPDGHPYLATSLNSLGALLQSTGEYGKAEPFYREALEMRRALFPRTSYPDGHPLLANSLNNLASLHQSAGEYARAEPLVREALQMYRGLLRRYADLAAEAEALNFAASQPLIRDGFLSATREPASAAAYDDLWDSRALLTRLQEQRHRYLAASANPALHDLAEQLHLARLTLSQRILRPLPKADDQQAEVRRLTDAKEDLEKRLAAQMHLPLLPPAETPAPQRLAARLPAGSCFIDLYRYLRFEQDPNIRGQKGEKRTPQYVAFVVRPGQGTARVELGDAAAIEQAWAAWHQLIMAARPDAAAERTAAAAVSRLLWEPLRRELPAHLTALYVTADAALHQLPWAALPGAQPGTVLLEEHAVCLVPHGPFLLQRLEEAPPEAAPSPGRLLAVGGIDYQDRAGSIEAAPALAVRGPALAPSGFRWPALDGTERERQQIAALARQTAHLEVTERAGKDATTTQVQGDLPSARYAHIATHGFFADPKFRSALQLDPNDFGQAGVPDRRGGARSPLTLSGLVFAGANQGGTETADDRGILTAEGLISLRLEGVDLAVLSACETGLGEFGGGEGVFGLQRAFHVAGCRNVVASLWKVNDGATQALMTLFYRNLWEKKLSPAQALRQAQLTLYRNPSTVAVAQRRGVDFTESDLSREAEKPAEKGKHSPTAHWAAFTFSGVPPVQGK